MTSIRVAIADDQRLFCSGIQMLIESQSDLEFAGAAYDGAAIVELALEARPDVILMDIRMPEANGITATESIRAQTGDTPTENHHSHHSRARCRCSGGDQGGSQWFSAQRHQSGIPAGSHPHSA